MVDMVSLDNSVHFIDWLERRLPDITSDLAYGKGKHQALLKVFISLLTTTLRGQDGGSSSGGEDQDRYNVLHLRARVQFMLTEWLHLHDLSGILRSGEHSEVKSRWVEPSSQDTATTSEEPLYTLIYHLQQVFSSPVSITRPSSASPTPFETFKSRVDGLFSHLETTRSTAIEWSKSPATSRPSADYPIFLTSQDTITDDLCTPTYRLRLLIQLLTTLNQLVTTGSGEAARSKHPKNAMIPMSFTLASGDIDWLKQRILDARSEMVKLHHGRETEARVKKMLDMDRHYVGVTRPSKSDSPAYTFMSQ